MSGCFNFDVLFVIYKIIIYARQQYLFHKLIPQIEITHTFNLDTERVWRILSTPI
jgi:hypothetical protein